MHACDIIIMCIVSVYCAHCIRLYQYAATSITYNNHTFRSLFRALSRSRACLFAYYLQRPEWSICEHKWQCGRCIERGGRCIEPGALSTSEFVSSSGSAEVASHASTSATAQQVQGWLMPAERLFRRNGIGDIGFDMFHISERCPLIFE